MRRIHSDIIGKLEKEVSNMQKWVGSNRRDVEIERILTTEENAIEVEEIKFKLESLFNESY